MKDDGQDLVGLRIVVTRPRHQAEPLSSRLEQLGAEVIHLPTITIADPESWGELDGAIEKLGASHYSWVIFTSANAVERFFGRLGAASLDRRAFEGTRVAAVGPSTEQRLAERGVRSDLVPDEFTAEAVAQKLGSGSGVVLLPRVQGAPREMVQVLEDAGWTVDEVTTYRTIMIRPPSPELEAVQEGGFDVVTFLSGSAAYGFSTVVGRPSQCGLSPADAPVRVVVCIGPKTARVAEDLGFRVDVVARDHTVEGICEAVVDARKGGTITA